MSLYLLLWISAALALAYSNWLVPRTDRAFPVMAVAILAPTFLGAFLLLRSPVANAALDAIPAHWFAFIQIYRVIGVVFLMLASDGLLSPYFANPTGWGDILVGVTAPLAGWLLWRDARRYKWAGILWCLAGIADLVVVLFKALNSAPGPMQTTAFDLPTVAIGYFPFPVIALLIVPISLILHAALLRKLQRL